MSAYNTTMSKMCAPIIYNDYKNNIKDSLGIRYTRSESVIAIVIVCV